MRKIISSKRSFTLIEMLVAVSVFSILIVAASNVFINFQSVKRRADLMRYIKNEGDFLMERIKREIRSGTVDYEEYYNQIVEVSGQYAANYGKYGRQFFDKGFCDILRDSQGFDGGFGVRCVPVNPYTCGDDYWTKACTPMSYESKDANIWEWTAGNALDTNLVNELYLIDASGTKRSILKLDPASGAEKLILLKLSGQDKNSNGIIDTWYCDPDFMVYNQISESDKCSSHSATYATKGFPYVAPANEGQDLGSSNSGRPFVSITPDRLQVTQLKFFVSPLEDPRKAKAEDLSEVYVTVILSVKPKAEYAKAIPGDIPEYTMQTTVTAGAKNFITTWHGVLQN